MNPQAKCQSFDDTLESIGFGKYQLRIYLTMGLLSLSEGAFLSIFTMTTPLVQKELQLGHDSIQLMTGLLFLGFNIGSICSGRISDNVGRKIPFFLSAVLSNVAAYLGLLFDSFQVILVFRVTQALLVGFFGPLGVTLLAQITPKSERGKYMSMFSSSIAIGQVFGYLMGLIILNNLQNGDWRLCTLLGNIPGTVSLVLGLFFIQQSARFLLLAGRENQGLVIVQNMNRLNGHSNFQSVDQQRRARLQNWISKIKSKDTQQVQIWSLCGKSLRLTTLLIWSNWGVLSFIYYGIVINMPNTIVKMGLDQQDNHSILSLLFASLVEISAPFIISLFIENKKLGRKNSLSLCYALVSLSSFAVFLFPNQFLILAATVRFFCGFIFVLLYQFTAQLYPTYIRSTGIGLANGLGRMSGIIMPVVYGWIESKSLLGPYALFGAIGTVLVLGNCLFPKDTTGCNLDVGEDEYQL